MIAQLFKCLYWESIEELLEHISVPSTYAEKGKRDSFKHTCVGIMVTGHTYKFDKTLQTILDTMTKSQLNLIKGKHTMLVFENGMYYKIKYSKSYNLYRFKHI